MGGKGVKEGAHLAARTVLAYLAGEVVDAQRHQVHRLAVGALQVGRQASWFRERQPQSPARKGLEGADLHLGGGGRRRYSTRDVNPYSNHDLTLIRGHRFITKTPGVSLLRVIRVARRANVVSS